MISLYANILHAACKVAEDLNLNQTLPAGHNGPYHDPETSVRNTGHWLITFARVYKWTGEEKYRVAASQCTAYLLSHEARPHNFSFHHRNGPKDHCNGLVGQAWTFESLVEASQLFNDPKYAFLAEDVFLQHPFDEEIGLWNRLEIDGQILPFDAAFNHQLWFAACAGMIKGQHDKIVRHRIIRFLDCLEKNLTVLDDGLLYHPIEHLFEKQLAEQFQFSKRIRKVIRACYYTLKGVVPRDVLKSEAAIRQEVQNKLIYKSIGYHSFNMYAFALLKPQFSDHVFWSSKQFRKMIKYMGTQKYRDNLSTNKYSYAYNPPGFEIPYSRLILEGLDLNDAIEVTTDWLFEQIQHCFKPGTCLFTSDIEDPITHSARIYEITRMPKDIIEQVFLKNITCEQ